jgi:RNA recognition motif-containing protein
MVNKSTGLSKGYGFVSFAYPEDAQAAIELMDGFRVSMK